MQTMKLQPQYLRRWFKPVIRGGEEASGIGARASAGSPSPGGDFPLFYLLLDHVHHDGRVGEFARTGLLYIVESSARSEVLEKWIVESDMATLMASGLGALYSQLSRLALARVSVSDLTDLSRKLVVSYDKDHVPLIVAFSDKTQPPTTFDAVETSSPDFKEGLTTFLNYLVFWQDVLENCTSHDVKQTLLDHLEFLFLKQLLWVELTSSAGSS